MLVEVAGLTRIGATAALITFFLCPSAAQFALTEAIARLVQGEKSADAIAVLQTAVQRSPNAARWWAWLGYAYCLQGDFAAAQRAYAQATEAPVGLAWLPPQFPVAWLAQWRALQPVAWGGTTFWCSLPTLTEPLSFTPPEHAAPFPWLITVYAAGEGDGGPVARQWVRWLMPTEHLPDHLHGAPVVFTAALHAFASQFQTPVSLPVCVWLFPHGDGSAKTITGNTLFYGTLPNDRWGWWLKMAHEAGHHAIPAFGAFDGLHEPYAGGFLGERLFALWLWDGQQTQPLPDDIAQGITVYLRSTVVPEIVAGQQWLLRNDDEAPRMPTFLGVCLYLERLVGSAFLSAAMKRAKGESWQAFVNGVQTAIGDSVRDGLTLRFALPDANTAPTRFALDHLRDAPERPTTQVAWHLPVGTFLGHLELDGGGELVMRWGDRTIGRWQLGIAQRYRLPLRFSVAETGWQRLRFWWLKGGGRIVALTVRQADERRRNAGERP